MTYRVQFTINARNDLRAIHSYIEAHDSKESADYILREIVHASLTLRQFPDRGAHPPELLALGVGAYRQIFFKPYRIVYSVRGSGVSIVLVADGRREMNSLLTRRLARS